MILLRRLGIGLLLLTVLTGVSAVAANAHAKLVSTSPVDGAILDVPPATVSFTFDEPLLEGTDTISINDSQGNVIATQSVQPDGATISAPWPAAAGTGMFQIAYRAVSDDGHPVSGAIAVTITSADTATTAVSASQSPATTTEPTTEPRGVAAWLVVVLGVAVLALIVVVGFTLARRRRA